MHIPQLKSPPKKRECSRFDGKDEEDRRAKEEGESIRITGDYSDIHCM
jgi:hypothetical protein